MQFDRFGPHTVLRLQPGEEVVSLLKAFVGREEIRGGYFIAFGAFSRVRLRYFDPESKQYRDNEVSQQVEVVSMMGNIACKEDGSPMLHIHVAVGDRHGKTYSGHLGEGTVDPTLELFLTKLDGVLHRQKDSATGLELLSLGTRFEPRP